MVRLHDYNDLREATTDAAGHFSIDEAPVHGAIVAVRGELRSSPQHPIDHIKLALGPTRTISGRVALGGLTHTEVRVSGLTDLGDMYIVDGPVHADGTFELAGAPTTKLAVAVVTSEQFSTQLQPKPLPAGTAPVTGLSLEVAASGRTLDVLVRSTLETPIETAQIVVMPGRVHVANVGELEKIIASGMNVRFARHVVGETVPRPALDQLKPGDLWARFSNTPTGDVTVCSLGLPADLRDQEALRKFSAHIEEVEIDCQSVGGDTKVVVAPTAPPKRYD